jgi:hypothetical protein
MRPPRTSQFRSLIFISCFASFPILVRFSPGSARIGSCESNRHLSWVKTKSCQIPPT